MVNFTSNLWLIILCIAYKIEVIQYTKLKIFIIHFFKLWPKIVKCGGVQNQSKMTSVFIIAYTYINNTQYHNKRINTVQVYHTIMILFYIFE